MKLKLMFTINIIIMVKSNSYEFYYTINYSTAISIDFDIKSGRSSIFINKEKVINIVLGKNARSELLF